MVAEAVKARGQGLDVIFANAGGGEFAPLSEVTVEQFTNTSVGRLHGRWLAADHFSQVSKRCVVPGVRCES